MISTVKKKRKISTPSAQFLFYRIPIDYTIRMSKSQIPIRTIDSRRPIFLIRILFARSLLYTIWKPPPKVEFIQNKKIHGKMMVNSL